MALSESTREKTASTDHPRTWIFQASPAIYDIARAIRELECLSWSVGQHQNEIRSGDHVIIWQPGPDGGVIALGTVISDPKEQEDRPEELPYYVEPPKEGAQLSVDVRVDRVLETPITRQQLLAEPGLASLSILRAPQSTNFSLTPSEANLLQLLVQERPTFETVIRRYHEDNVVYQSTERAACYAVAEVDADGFSVDRLSADQPVRCTFAFYDEKLNEFRQSGGKVPYSSLFSNTVAIRASLLPKANIDEEILFSCMRREWLTSPPDLDTWSAGSIRSTAP